MATNPNTEPKPCSPASSSVHKSDLEKDSFNEVDHAKIRSAVRKLDWTILPMMTMFYLLSFLDRANIGNARVAGLQKGLKMTDRQYQICVTVTYVPYIMAEVPANLLLRKIGPNIAMPVILTLWGIIVIFQGFVSSFHDLIAARFFLGLVEGPMFPGIVLYLSGFYTRAELSYRIAFFFSAASLSSAFSGLLAAAIDNMQGLGGKPAWAWIFILEGIFSVLMGVLGFFMVPATPRESRFLSDNQKDLVMRRLEKDRPFVNPLDEFRIRHVLSSLKSPHVILMFITFFMGGTNLFGLALFAPSIINQLGFSPNHSQLLSVGPFASAFVVTLVVAYTSDRLKSRAIPLCSVCLIGIAGYAMYLGTTNKHAAYGAIYLMASGIYGTVPVIAAWISNNSEPYYTRATSIAVGFMATSMGGILSTWRYPTSEGPRFHKTTVMNLIFMIMTIVLAIVNASILSWKNKNKERTRQEVLAPYATESEPDGGVRAWVDLGDRHPDFRYTL
ncbi:putative transporter [Psilocybe cubensis]|uniref:Transporter n=2 Tax=Psilocybe cubensis TaxID=181762 RepID=A0ACB8GM48_PSICU|nr:putative transporter [Psilocybe cubensis]KAH9476723.1 putative transporter [Psilocybe cubensis]